MVIYPLGNIPFVEEVFKSC